MTSKKIFSYFLTTTFIALSLIILADQGSAQGRYANTYSRNQVSDIIRRAENSSDKFRTDFRNQMNRNNSLSGSQKSQFNSYVASCEDALDRLRSNFDRDNTWWNSRSQVQDVVNSSQNVNTMMSTLPFRRNLENQWNSLRNDINTLADTYDLPGLNGGGWNGGPWNPGNPGNPGGPGNWPGWQTSRPPSWAVGTFYSMNSSDSIQLTIDSNGRITVVNNGQSFWGRYYNNQIYLNNDVSTVSRNGNGISTYNRSNGQTTNYSRNGVNPGYPGNPGGPGNWPGWQTSRPPSWAVGTFYSMNSSDSIQLTIDSNGRITVVNNGQSFWGRYYNNQIYLNNDVSTVSRNGNGISTYNRSNGQTTNYSRNGVNPGYPGNPGWGGNTSSPPSWAQGTFYSTNNGSIYLTINRSGQVTVVNGGQTFYGTYYNGAITINGDTSTLTRNGNGIRTYNQNTGQTTNYRRR